MKGILQATLTLALVAIIVAVLAIRIWSWFGFALEETRPLYCFDLHSYPPGRKASLS